MHHFLSSTIIYKKIFIYGYFDFTSFTIHFDLVAESNIIANILVL